MRILTALLGLALCGCATTGTETAKLSQTAAAVRHGTTQVQERVRADLSDVEAIESDGKQILRIINGR